jgi:hypothetical protein
VLVFWWEWPFKRGTIRNIKLQQLSQCLVILVLTQFCNNKSDWIHLALAPYNFTALFDQSKHPATYAKHEEEQIVETG